MYICIAPRNCGHDIAKPRFPPNLKITMVVIIAVCIGKLKKLRAVQDVVKCVYANFDYRVVTAVFL